MRNNAFRTVSRWFSACSTPDCHPTDALRYALPGLPQHLLNAGKVFSRMQQPVLVKLPLLAPMRLPAATPLSRARSVPPAPLKPLHAWILLACMALVPAGPVWAQTAPATAPANRPLILQSSPWLEETLPDISPQRAPILISGQQFDGEIDRHITATGQPEVRHPGSVLKADVIRHDQATNTLTAQGNVRLNRMGNRFRGDRLQLQLDSYEGSFDNISFEIIKTGGLGKASRADFIDRDHSIIYDAMYSTCYPDPEHPGAWNPDWFVRGKKIILDTEQDEGHVEDGALVFAGVPIFPVPGFSFPLSDKRRSGLLPPTIHFSSRSGITYSQPYYFDIAPNRDATVAANISSKRGIDLYGQFRYLEQSYHGQLDFNVMPDDQLTGTKRWSYNYVHKQTWPTQSWGTFGLSADLSRVSDNTYWRDFQEFNEEHDRLISERLVPSTVVLSWNLGNWSAHVREQRWQTLQLPAPDNITPPFDVSPQAHLRYARSNVAGLDVALDLDVTRFRSDPSLTGYPNGTRSYANASVSYPWMQPWGFAIPTLEWNATHYQTDTAMPNGARSATRVLPTFTLDSGLIFERDTNLFGRKVSQTLEPRLFYAYTPYRQQDHLPVYDSALKDFNLTSIFSSNPFTGSDRISNNNTLTAGLTSRLYDSDTGSELARLSVAQRHRFTPRQVFLHAADKPEKRSFSDILAEASINWTPQWGMQALLDYDQQTSTIANGRIGARYSPGRLRSITANLSRQSDGYKQIDAGWQWPINGPWEGQGKDPGLTRVQGKGRWYSVGRVYYSLSDRRITDALLGIEYDSCCWIARLAWRRRQTQTLPVVVNNSIMVQLELTGLTRIGTGALQAFRENIPGYTPLREPRLYQSSRFERYD